MEKLKRYVVFLFGLFISSLGVSLITRANLGTSPISSIPYVLSLNFSHTLGEFTIYMSLVLVALQIIILRKNFKLEYWLQIPISFAFGYFIDLTMIMLKWLDPQAYIFNIISLVIGCFVLGFGVYLEVLANVAMLPGESFVRSIVQTFKTEFGITKICFDVSMTVIAIALSFIFAGRLDGVREGTVIAALLVGYIARFLKRVLAPVEQRLFPAAEAVEAEPVLSHTVLAIGRQYGSGGHEIGMELAKRLGYEFYDGAIIKEAAGTTGYTPEFIKKNEETMSNRFLFDLINHTYGYSAEHSAPKDNIFAAETKAVLNAVSKGNCVIVGRCSDYMLKDNPNCIKLFLHASMPARIKRIMKRNRLDSKAAEAKILKEDKLRADNYHYYTGQLWGYAGNYNVSIDTSYGIDYIEKIVRDLIDKTDK